MAGRQWRRTFVPSSLVHTHICTNNTSLLIKIELSHLQQSIHLHNVFSLSILLPFPSFQGSSCNRFVNNFLSADIWIFPNRVSILFCLNLTITQNTTQQWKLPVTSIHPYIYKQLNKCEVESIKQFHPNPDLSTDQTVYMFK